MNHDKEASTSLTHETIHSGLSRHHASMVSAVHEVLRNAGLHGLTVHSITFNTPQGIVSPCPPCPEGQTCAPVSTGHGTVWQCV